MALRASATRPGSAHGRAQNGAVVLPGHSTDVSIGMRSRRVLGAAFLLGLVIAIGVCVGGNRLLGAKSLPTASATLHWATVDLPRGSYCWNTGGHGECADSASADQLVVSGYLKPYKTAGGFDVNIVFHSASQPNSFHVQLIQSPHGSISTINESRFHSFMIGVSPPAKAGLYVYVVTGMWSEGDVSFYLPLQLIPGVA